MTLTVTDSYGGVGTFQQMIVVQSAEGAADNIIAFVETLSQLNDGQQNDLIVKLNAAIRAIEDEGITPASKQLDAFINQIDAFKTNGKLDEATANALIADAEALKASL